MTGNGREGTSYFLAILIYIMEKKMVKMLSFSFDTVM